MDREGAQAWLDRYVAAWRSYDRDEIADLFSADVAYRYHPYDEPVTGRDAVVASWLGEEGDGPVGTASTRDAPDTYDAHYAPVAVDGNTVVATGRSTLPRHPGRTGRAGLRELLRDPLRRPRTVPRVHRVLHRAARGPVTEEEPSA